MEVQQSKKQNCYLQFKCYSPLAGGVSGLLLGSQVAKRYDYSLGDVDAISSLTVISVGIGFTGIAESRSDVQSLILIPAISSVAATILAQRQVRGAHLTDKQGSTINLSTAGAALVGLGIVTAAKTESAGVLIGVPSGLALITHQILLHNFKMKNLEMNLRGSSYRKNKYKLALRITPESYFLNQRIHASDYSPQTYARLQNPLFNLSVTF